MKVSEIETILPPHKCGLYLEHNPHRDTYDTVEQWVEDHDIEDDDWVTPEDRQRAIETDEVWTLQWYPETPAGFHFVAAATFEGLMKAMIGAQSGNGYAIPS